MKLSKLTLHGYKTFASRTVFEFDDGITAIVGPNGSGKSNIADAIRWVLGEQSFGSLRGKRTEDMIFAGSRERPRAGMAQAVITLNNSSNWLPIDYSEIEIGRRAYRSGENEYLLNGQKVRLRDIVELLAGGGLAQHNYTIISQGLVDQALSLRADERRELFEQAAGVSQYKLRRAETLRRLRETDHNLERLQDILTEIKPRINNLRRQAKRAKNYGQIASDLRYHLRIWYGFRWESGSKHLQSCRVRGEKARTAWESGRQKLQIIQQDYDSLRLEITTLQMSLQEQVEERDKHRDLVARVRQEVAVLTERQRSLEAQLNELNLEIPPIVAKHKKAQEETNQALIELEAAQKEFDQRQADFHYFEANTEAVRDDIKQLQLAVVKFEKKKNELLSTIARATGQKSFIASQIDRLSSDDTGSDDLDESRRQLDLLAGELVEASKQLDQVEQQILELDGSRAGLVAAIDDDQQLFNLLAEKRNQIREGVLTYQAKLGELNRLTKKPGEISDDVNLVGKFSDLVHIPDKYQIPIHSALAFKLATYVVKESSDFWQLLANTNGQSMSIADLSAINAPPSPAIPDGKGIIGWAASLVRGDSNMESLVRLLLGQVLIVQNKEHAYALAPELPAGTVAVTLDGFIAYAGGLFRSGPEQAYVDRIAFEEDAGQIRLSLEEEEATLAEIERKLSAVTSEIKVNSDYLAEINEAVGKLEAEKSSLMRQIMDLDKSQELVQQNLDFTLKRLARERSQKEAQLKQLEEIDSLLAEQDGQIGAIDDQLNKARSRLGELPVSETKLELEQNQQRMEAARTILAGRQAVVDSRRATLNQLDDQLRRRQARVDALEAQQELLLIEERTRDLDELNLKLEGLEAAVKPLRVDLASKQDHLSILEKKLADQQEQNHSSEDLFTQARIDTAQAENQIENLRERISSDLGLVALSNTGDLASQSPLPMADVVEKLPVVEELPKDIEDIISRYRGQLTRMGPVNLGAQEEYVQERDRFENMSQQVEDLTLTKSKLERVIDDLDNLTSAAFADTVKEVDKEFGSVFRRLFGGGSAQLLLTDPDDITNSGVDIVARLPRRREQGLALLSGGERSLTAAALIFSLLKVSPTPFCVLDEVDAMLDEANVNRFRELLHELSDKTQFILITHNRGTVQVAETVYGVSMGADSVSQVISIHPEDYLKHHQTNQ